MIVNSGSNYTCWTFDGHPLQLPKCDWDQNGRSIYKEMEKEKV